MPLIKSAKKRVRTTRKATIRNSKTKRSLKDAMKVFNRKPTAAAHSSAQSSLDKAVKKGLVHKNKAARLKKKASARAKAAGVKPGPGVKKSAAPKKTTAKKSVAKKPTAKKPAAPKKK